MQRVGEQAWSWVQRRTRQAEETTPNIELITWAAFLLAPIVVGWLLETITGHGDLGWQNAPVAAKVAFVAYLVVWPLTVVAVRAWWFRGMRWRYRVASFGGWGLLAIELSFVVNMWLVIPRLGVPPKNSWLIVAVIGGFSLTACGMVWMLRRQR